MRPFSCLRLTYDAVGYTSSLHSLIHCRYTQPRCLLSYYQWDFEDIWKVLVTSLSIPSLKVPTFTKRKEKWGRGFVLWLVICIAKRALILLRGTRPWTKGLMRAYSRQCWAQRWLLMQRSEAPACVGALQGFVVVATDKQVEHLTRVLWALS